MDEWQGKFIEEIKHSIYAYQNEMIEAEVWVRRWDFPTVKSYYYYTAYRNYRKSLWGIWVADDDADTFHYISATAVWSILIKEDHSQAGYIMIHDYYLWANNHGVITLNNIPYSTSVTFTLNYSWFKRNLVDGIALTHAPKTL